MQLEFEMWIQPETLSQSHEKKRARGNFDELKRTEAIRENSVWLITVASCKRRKTYHNRINKEDLPNGNCI